MHSLILDSGEKSSINVDLKIIKTKIFNNNINYNKENTKAINLNKIFLVIIPNC